MRRVCVFWESGSGACQAVRCWIRPRCHAQDAQLFRPAGLSERALEPDEVQVSDTNGDGIPDVIGNSLGHITVLLGNVYGKDNGTFQSPVSLTTTLERTKCDYPPPAPVLDMVGLDNMCIPKGNLQP